MTPDDGAIKQVVEGKDDGATKSETRATEVANSVSSWKRDSDSDNSDALVRLMRDQLIMARAYANIAQGQAHYDLVRDLKLQIKEHTSIVGDANVDAELPAGYILKPLLSFLNRISYRILLRIHLDSDRVILEHEGRYRAVTFLPVKRCY